MHDSVARHIYLADLFEKVAELPGCRLVGWAEGPGGQQLVAVADHSQLDTLRAGVDYQDPHR